VDSNKGLTKLGIPTEDDNLPMMSGFIIHDIASGTTTTATIKLIA
jgi:hypothetical protein